MSQPTQFAWISGAMLCAVVATVAYTFREGDLDTEFAPSDGEFADPVETAAALPRVSGDSSAPPQPADTSRQGPNSDATDKLLRIRGRASPPASGEPEATALGVRFSAEIAEVSNAELQAMYPSHEPARHIGLAIDADASHGDPGPHYDSPERHLGIPIEAEAYFGISPDDYGKTGSQHIGERLDVEAFTSLFSPDKPQTTPHHVGKKISAE